MAPPRPPLSTFQKRQHFPNLPITLISTYRGTPSMPPKASFKVKPEMTKHEVKEYLQKIYGVRVEKVNTMIFPESRKFEARGPTGRRLVRTPSWKKAIVRFVRPEEAEAV